MKNQKFLISCLLVCLCLSGCSKNSSTQNSANFGESESTEETSKIIKEEK